MYDDESYYDEHLHLQDDDDFHLLEKYEIKFLNDNMLLVEQIMYEM
jgi:hypothetical protein